MLTAIVVLFFVVILMICLHLYARWYLLRARRRQMRRRSRRQNLVFYVDPANPNPNPAGVESRGLPAAVLKSLPVFVYSGAAAAAPPAECAVCLSEFEEKEAGRTLPKCAHSFHTECIDMWFHSHSTCPLCRSPVEPLPAIETLEPSTSAGGRKSRGELGIEVPGRNFGEEPSSSAVAESPAVRGSGRR
ncbi:unnamed protein product [Linum tenue]|uniref:RING-type E3 ubiquitin transferase n=2 Tax=Linum tenue TaxID=586396 RepID=A0AAV0S4Q4_9ROSI|nr:unnamed protein product [Linum tenue]